MKENEITMKVTGMTCAACARAVERSVMKVDGVADASVNLVTEKLTVIPRETAPDKSLIENAVKKAGYGVEEKKSSKISIDIDGMTCVACASRIEREILKVDGVIEASVNFAAARATVEFREGEADSATLNAAIKRAGYTPVISHEESGTEEVPLIQRPVFNLSLSVIFIVPLALLTMGHMAGIPLPDKVSPESEPLTNAVLQLLFTIPILFAGRRFYVSGFNAFSHGGSNMDSLIALGTSAAVIYSLWGLFEFFSGEATYINRLYFESAGFIITLILVGKFMEDKAKGRTSSAIKALLNLAPPTANLAIDGSIKQIPAEDIKPGDILLVKAGERIPADGVITDGDAEVDESMLTGESLPVTKPEGSNVTGGTINGSSVFKMKAEKVGKDTVLSQIVKLVEEAQGSKAPIAALADRVSAVFVPSVLAIAFISASIWLLAGKPFTFALSVFISVLIIACPCALGLATPTAIMVGTGRGAQLGILIKNGIALERASSIDTVLFDKTGTITLGKPMVTELIPYNGFSNEELWFYAGSLESASEHPLSKAIVAGAKEEGVSLANPERVKTTPGFGIAGLVNGKEVVIGKPEFLAQNGLSLPNESDMAEGVASLFVGIGGKAAGCFRVADEIRPTSREAVRELAEMGLHTGMITGDKREVAKKVADEAGIEELYAEVLPEEKELKVKALQESGRKVGMVGDGINDAPALARADIGIAIGTGTDVAIESADIVLVGGHPEGVPRALRLSKATIRNIKQNLFWAFFYNSLGIPVAAGILTVFGGPLLSPTIAAAAMSFSSISVLLNALRLKKFT